MLRQENCQKFKANLQEFSQQETKLSFFEGSPKMESGKQAQWRGAELVPSRGWVTALSLGLSNKIKHREEEEREIKTALQFMLN